MKVEIAPSLKFKYLNILAQLFIILVVLKNLSGCFSTRQKAQPSQLSTLDDWQILDQKIRPLGTCEQDEIVAQIVRKMLEKDSKSFPPQAFRNLLYSELKGFIEKHRGIRTTDIKSIFIKVVSANGKPNPYMIRDLGFSPEQIFTPLEEFAHYLEEESNQGRFDLFKHRALISYLSPVALQSNSWIDRGFRESLRWKYPTVSWERTTVRHFHLMELTHLSLERLSQTEAEQLSGKIKYLSHLQTLLVQVQDKESIGKLGRALSSLKQIKSLYLTKTNFWGSITLEHVNLLELEKSPHITTFGFSSDLGFNHDQDRSTIPWSQIAQWKTALTHVKTLVYVDGFTYRFGFDTILRSEQIQILKALGQLKKFETLEILELTGDTLAQLPAHDLRIDAEQVRIRSHYFKDIHPPKAMPTLNLDVLKYVFSTARSVTLEKVFIQTGRLLQASNQWEELNLVSCQPLYLGFTAKNPYTIAVDPAKDQALKKILLDNSPLFKVSAETEHLFQIRRTPVIPLVYHWNATRERLDVDAEFLIKNLPLDRPPKI